MALREEFGLAVEGIWYGVSKSDVSELSSCEREAGKAVGGIRGIAVGSDRKTEAMQKLDKVLEILAPYPEVASQFFFLDMKIFYARWSFKDVPISFYADCFFFWRRF